MPMLFYISSLVALAATVMAITRYHPVHALLYLVVSFLAMAMIFLSLGAPFVAVLEVIVYAGAIIVLFIFVVMMLNLGEDTAQQERAWLRPKVWLITWARHHTTSASLGRRVRVRKTSALISKPMTASPPRWGRTTG